MAAPTLFRYFNDEWLTDPLFSAWLRYDRSAKRMFCRACEKFGTRRGGKGDQVGGARQAGRQSEEGHDQAPAASARGAGVAEPAVCSPIP